MESHVLSTTLMIFFSVVVLVQAAVMVLLMASKQSFRHGLNSVSVGHVVFEVFVEQHV